MNLSNEQLQEKKQHLENELRKLQSELVDVLNINDMLTLQNKEKDETISNKEKKLAEIKDKNQLDLDQLRTERICMIDRYDHEMDIIENSIKRVELSRERYEQLEKENVVIQSAIEKLRLKMSRESKQHALEVHAINASTRIMREQMEAAFRKELIEMDLVFQRQAFSSMDDNKKKALLANSKLKDELALQSVGISNLTVRCGRDKQNQKIIREEMKKVSQKIESLRQRLSTLQLKKMNTLLDITIFENDLKLMSEKEKMTLQDLKHWPDKEDLLDATQEIHDLYCSEKYEFNQWNKRMKKLQELYHDMKSIKSSNKSLLRSLSSTIYQKQTSLSGTTSPAQTTGINKISFSTPVSPRGQTTASSNISSPINENIIYESLNTSNENLSYQIHSNPNIKDAFLPLIGRESTLLPPTSIVAQCVKQVLYILQDKSNKLSSKDDKSESDESSTIINLPKSTIRNNINNGNNQIQLNNNSNDNNKIYHQYHHQQQQQHHHHHYQQQQHPFSQKTEKLLQLIPNLKRNVYWNKEDIPSGSPLEKSTIPFANYLDGEEEEEGEEENNGDNDNEFYRNISNKLSKDSNEKRDEILSNNNNNNNTWFKKYQNILTDDLFLNDEEGNNANQLITIGSSSMLSPLSKSPISKIPLSFPPLSNKSQNNNNNNNTIESFPLISNNNHNNHSSNSSISSGKASKTKRDPLHNPKKKLVNSSSEVILPYKFKHMNKSISMNKL